MTATWLTRCAAPAVAEPIFGCIAQEIQQFVRNFTHSHNYLTILSVKIFGVIFKHFIQLVVLKANTIMYTLVRVIPFSWTSNMHICDMISSLFAPWHGRRWKNSFSAAEEIQRGADLSKKYNIIPAFLSVQVVWFFIWLLLQPLTIRYSLVRSDIIVSDQPRSDDHDQGMGNSI